uniref:Uncharacterized protein n=1 Tax=Cuerna arida TaxID=1464854 RepID=A0A1B6GYF2_9HEMI
MDKCLWCIVILQITIIFLNYCNCIFIKQSIDEICRSFILNKQLIECYNNNKFLYLLGESVSKIKHEILEPLHEQLITPSVDSETDLTEYYLKLQQISSHINSIQCKKKVVKKGVRRKIKKFQSTEGPREASVEGSDESDGWTLENLKLMMDYYEEMQAELAEMRKLIK